MFIFFFFFNLLYNFLKENKNQSFHNNKIFFFFWLSSQSAFEDFTFERILKAIKMNSMTPCKTEGCEKLSFVDHIIPTLPSVFTIGKSIIHKLKLYWRSNIIEFYFFFLYGMV